MPIYEYVCMECESHFEELVRGAEQVACPDCAATNVSRQFSSFAVHGVTKQVSLKGEYLGSQPSPWGDTRIGFSAETEVSRSDWGINFNIALETGGVVVSDKIKLAIDAEWIAQ